MPKMDAPNDNLDTLHSLAERIRLVRGSMTRADFAQKIGIHLNTLGHYERGQRAPDALVLIAICRIFAVKSSWLLFGEGPALDEDRITIEPTHAGSMRAGQALARIVVKDRKDMAHKPCNEDKLSFTSETIQSAIISIEQALSESQKVMTPEKKSELVVAVCELLNDMDNSTASERILRLIRLSA